MQFKTSNVHVVMNGSDESAGYSLLLFMNSSFHGCYRSNVKKTTLGTDFLVKCKKKLRSGLIFWSGWQIFCVKAKRAESGCSCGAKRRLTPRPAVGGRGRPRRQGAQHQHQGGQGGNSGGKFQKGKNLKLKILGFWN